MPADAADARALFQVPPDQYVTERARLTKLARADGDRALASFYQSLKRPTLALWAVLAAGDDSDAVHSVITTTTKLAKIQAGGADSGALSAATQHRRKALEALVDAAVAALAGSVAGAEARRPEIRDTVDQLSRHPDLAEAWIDGTLRELPDDAFGFAAFADLEATSRSHGDAPKTDRTPRTEKVSTDRSARAERAEQVRGARKEIAAAALELAAAERRVAAARAAVRDAEKEMRLAEKDREAAEQRRDEATARLEAIRDG